MERNPPTPLTPLLDEYKLRDTLEAAQEELVKAMREREHLEWRINKLQNDILHLAALCQVEVEDPFKQLGLTDAVRWIFAREKDRSLDVQQVADELARSYKDASAYKNLPANVHTIFRRLLKAGEIKPSTEIPSSSPLGKIGNERDRYVWSGGLPPLPPRHLTAQTVGRTKPWKPPTT